MMMMSTRLHVKIKKQLFIKLCLQMTTNLKKRLMTADHSGQFLTSPGLWPNPDDFMAFFVSIFYGYLDFVVSQ
jgi:hypothetical protein